MTKTIDIDEELFAEALRVSGAASERELVELGLRTLVRWSRQRELRKLKGTMKWDGSLEDMRTDQ